VGGKPVNIAPIADLQSIQDVAWSPQEDRIAFVGTRRGESFFDTRIFSVGADGRDLAVLTDSPGNYATPTWSPDGTKLVFTVNFVPAGSDLIDVLYIANADGSGIRPFTGLNESASAPAWGP
jgi:Tol biopolymer transport system component